MAIDLEIPSSKAQRAIAKPLLLISASDGCGITPQKFLEQVIDVIRLKHYSYKTEKVNPSIILGVSIGLLKPVTIAILDTQTQAVLAYRTTKQLLNQTHQVLEEKVKVEKDRSFRRTFKEIDDYELFQ